MEICIHTEPAQYGASYADLLRVAATAEILGFTGFFRSEHYLQFGAPGRAPGPTDAWTTLAGLARDTVRLRLGTLVSPNTFRSPGQLAIQVAQVDQMSGGRIELGLGAGWFEQEHTAYGIPFPRERFGRLEESLEILTGLWGAEEGYDFAGKHYTLTGAQPTLKPVQRPNPPIIIGGVGTARTTSIAARWATEYNVPFAGEEQVAPLYRKVTDEADALGRDPGMLKFSVLQTVCCGKDEAQVAAREEALHEPLRPGALRGSPDQLVDRIGRYAEAGADRVYLRLLDLGDLDHLELIAADVLRQLR